MAKPTFLQRVLRRPSQRYSLPDADPDADTDADTAAPDSSPAASPPLSAASSALSLALSDESTPAPVPASPSLPDHTTIRMAATRTLTYTDEDWANDVRFLLASRPDPLSRSSKAAKRRSAPPSILIPSSRSTSSLPPRLPASVPHPHPTRASKPKPKPKPISKAKISTARSVVGMSALLEVEEDLDPDLVLPYPHNAPIPQKRVGSISRYPDHPPAAYHKPRVSSPLRSSKLTRQRSFSSPPSLLPDQSEHSAATCIPDLSRAPSPRRAHSTTSRLSTYKSPYTSPAPNVLDALAAHVSVSDSHDTLPSSGTRGYTTLVLPHAASSPSLSLDHASTRVWKIGKRPHGATLRDTIGAGLGFGDQVDLSRARLAQTTMATVEVVRGIAAGSAAARKSHRSRPSVLGVTWFSKDKQSATADEKDHRAETDSPLGFTAYRKPPVYVGGGSVLVQVWGVGLDGTDARLTGIHPSRSGSSSFARAPYGTKMPKTSEKDKARCPPTGYIPGRSFVGRVLEVGWEVGPDVAKRGDWVVGLMSVHKCGALSEFILADRHRVHRIQNPFMHLKYPFSSSPLTETANEANGNVSKCPDSSPTPPAEECLTVNELALLPLCGVPAYRAVRTFHHITQSMSKSQLPYGNSHNELHPIIPPRSDRHDYVAGGDQDDVVAQVQPLDSRPRVLILRAHDGAGAFAVQMLVREGWSVWAHVPVPFMLPGAPSELPDELKDEEEERELDNQRNMLRRIEDRLREWGVDEVLFVPVTSMPLSALFDASNPALEAMSSLSSPSLQFTRSPSSSPSISPSPFSRSTTSTPLSSPYSNGLSSGYLSSPASSSSHQNAFVTPYSFAPLPLTPYDCEPASVVSLMAYLTRSRVRLDAVLDSIGGREIWDAGRVLLGQPVRDLSRRDVDAQFTTLVGDAPDRVVSTAGDNFRAGVRALRLGGGGGGGGGGGRGGGAKTFDDSGYHEAVTAAGGYGKDKDKDKKTRAKLRPVNYSWVNVVSDIDWEGGDVHDTLCAVMRMASTEGVKPVVGGPADFAFANAGRRDRGGKMKRAVAAVAAADGIEEQQQGEEEQYSGGKVVSFESTPDVFSPGGGLEHGGTIVSRVAA